MQAPNLIKAKNVARSFREVQVQYGDEWLPARPHYPFLALGRRIRLAWGVFTGRYDALDWEYR